MTTLTGFRQITEALDRWRAAGLFLPCDSPESRRQLQRVWLERYKQTEADLFMECVDKLAARRYFPRLYDMDEALAEARTQRKLQAKIAAGPTAAAQPRPLADKKKQRQQIKEIIAHLQAKFTVNKAAKSRDMQ